MSFKITSKILDKLLLIFFIFGSLFISIRLLLIGSHASQNSGELILAALPEVFVIFILMFFLRLKMKEKIKFHLIDWIFLLFIISNLTLGLWIGKDLKIGLYGFRMTYLPMCFYFIGSFAVSSKLEILNLIDRIFKWFAFVGGVGLVLYFLFFDFSQYMLFKVSPIIPEYFIIRMTSVFWSPVVFGTFSTISFLYFYNKSLSSDSYWNYFFQAILFVGTLMSMSRGAFLGLILGIILLAILSGKWKKMLVTTSLTIMLFVPFSFYIDSPVTVTKWVFNSTVKTVKMDDNDKRVKINKSSIGEIKKNPLGKGLGKAGHVAVRFSKSKNDGISEEDLSVNSTDGWLVKLTCETGFWGLGTYLGFNLLLFIQSVIYFRKNEFGFFGFLLTVLIVVNFQNLVSNVLDFYLFSYLYWFLIGIMVLYIKSTKELEIS